MYSSKWSVEEFEGIADETDSRDEQYLGDAGKSRDEYSKLNWAPLPQSSRYRRWRKIYYSTNVSPKLNV